MVLYRIESNAVVSDRQHISSDVHDACLFAAGGLTAVAPSVESQWVIEIINNRSLYWQEPADPLSVPVSPCK